MEKTFFWDDEEFWNGIYCKYRYSSSLNTQGPIPSLSNKICLIYQIDKTNLQTGSFKLKILCDQKIVLTSGSHKNFETKNKLSKPKLFSKAVGISLYQIRDFSIRSGGRGWANMFNC